MRSVVGTIWLVVAVVALGPSWASARARSRYVFGNPQLRGLRRVGGTFSDYSTGLGDLRMRSRGPGGSLLRSGIGRAGSYSLSRGASRPQATRGGVSGSSSMAGQRYGTVGLDLHSLARPRADLGMGRSLSPDSVGGIGVYLGAMGHMVQDARTSGEQIKSFVPAETSMYQAAMLKADKAFRGGMYLEANDHLSVAMALARDAPELNLSLVLTNLAMRNYHSAVFHLKKALTVFPELPLVKMDLRDFYGKTEDGNVRDFQKHRAGLLELQRGFNRDTVEWMLLTAYIHYFSGSPEKAAPMLRRMFGKARTIGNEELIEVASVFWDGMVAAGKVTGSLDPTQAQPTTRSAEKETPAESDAPDAVKATPGEHPPAP